MTPYKLPTPCSTPGCHRLSHTRFCDECNKAYEAERGSAAERGYNRTHRAWRKLVLHRHPVCKCGQPSTVADHIVPLSQGGTWALTNGQGMCKPCHDAKTRREQRARGAY